MNILRYGLFVAIMAGASLTRATTMIYPADAIDEFWNLNADEFRQKYAGINATGLGPSDEGWYVRYKHENLTCLFGPLADREEARKRKWDMETVRDAAIRNRASLASSQVDFVRFTFSGVYGKGGGGGGGGNAVSATGLGRISADGKSGPDGDLDGDGIPNALDDDMDGDGIPNALDDDIDGDGIPNSKDDYGYGTMDDKIRAGTGLVDGNGNGNGDGKGGKDGKGGSGANGEGKGDESMKIAENGANGIGRADGKGGKGKGGKGGKGGSGSEAGGDGGEDGSGGQGGQGGQNGRQVASNQRGGGQQGGMGGQQGSMGGQSGSQGGQSGQSGGQQGGQQGSQGGQSGGSSGGGQPGGGGGPSMPGSSGGGGGNPLSLITGLLKAILGM